MHGASGPHSGQRRPALDSHQNKGLQTWRRIGSVNQKVTMCPVLPKAKRRMRWIPTVIQAPYRARVQRVEMNRKMCR